MITLPFFPRNFDRIYHMYQTADMTTTKNHIEYGLKNWRLRIWLLNHDTSIHACHNRFDIEYLWSGRSGRITKAITANFIEWRNSSFETLAIIRIEYSFIEITMTVDIAIMIQSVLCQSHITTQIIKLIIAENSLVRPISPLLKDEYA